MIRSLEKALNKFGETNSALVLNSELTSKVGNIIIPKTRLENILTEDMFYSHFGSEVIAYKKLCAELGISWRDVEDTFDEKYKQIFKVNNKWGAKERKKNNQKVLEILDLIITEDGWKASKSDWYSNIPNNLIESIDSFGFPEVKSIEKPNYIHFNIAAKDKLLIVDPIILNDKIQILKLLNLYDDVISRIALDLGVDNVAALEKLESYITNYSLQLVTKIEICNLDKNVSRVIIKTGVIIPTKINEVKDRLITSTCVITYDDFIRMSNMLVARKKLLKAFRKKEIQLTDLKSLKKEKVLWFNDSPHFYMYELQDNEIKLIEDTIKCNLSGYRKTIKINWLVLKNIFDSVQLFYTQFENKNISVPSGPDTSKFTATKSGWIQVGKDFRMGESYYSSGTYYKYGLKVGGNFTYGKPRAVMLYLLKYIEKFYGLPNYSDGSKIYIRSNCGTNFSAVGVG